MRKNCTTRKRLFGDEREVEMCVYMPSRVKRFVAPGRGRWEKTDRPNIGAWARSARRSLCLSTVPLLPWRRPPARTITWRCARGPCSSKRRAPLTAFSSTRPISRWEAQAAERGGVLSLVPHTHTHAPRPRDLLVARFILSFLRLDQNVSVSGFLLFLLRRKDSYNCTVGRKEA